MWAGARPHSPLSRQAADAPCARRGLSALRSRGSEVCSLLFLKWIKHFWFSIENREEACSMCRPRWLASVTVPRLRTSSILRPTGPSGLRQVGPRAPRAESHCGLCSAILLLPGISPGRDTCQGKAAGEPEFGGLSPYRVPAQCPVLRHWSLHLRLCPGAPTPAPHPDSWSDNFG